MDVIEPVQAFRARPSFTRFDNGLFDRWSGNIRKKDDRVRIGLLVPFSGSDAIWGPSCQYSATLAAAQINASGGILGCETELFAADAGGPPDVVAHRVRKLVEDSQIHACVGVHLSNVREAVSRELSGLVPYIFAPQYEGGQCHEGVIAIGETPVQQYSGTVSWMIKQRKAEKWYLLGNDYIWPRQTNKVLRTLIQASGGTVIAEEYLPLGGGDHARILDRIKATGPDVVFESLVGSESVRFNKSFGKAGLSGRIARLSGAIEENTLMGIGPEYSENLFCVSGYFNTIDTQENKKFLSDYHKAFGVNAPIQGAISQSCYESLFALEALTRKSGSLDVSNMLLHSKNFSYAAARGVVNVSNNSSEMTAYLMQSDGLVYKQVKVFPGF